MNGRVIKTAKKQKTENFLFENSESLCGCGMKEGRGRDEEEKGSEHYFQVEEFFLFP